MTSTPEFCASCHVMEYQHDAWLKNADHRHLDCVECHLPNNNFVNHIMWKGYDGTKDVIFFYGRLYADELRISAHGKRTIQENCIRCHGEMVFQINTDDRDCWSCHRRVNHNFPMASLGQ
jgi:cytochrome c nitrite reductase small subunit